MSEKPAVVIMSQEELSAPASNRNSKISSERGFFPWLEGDTEYQKLSFRSLRRFPVLGAVGLIGSLVCCMLALAVILIFDGKRVIDEKHMKYFPKPSAWLSAVIAANGICLHMAVSKGISTSWWYRASKKETTVADLHNVWDKGTSVYTAVTRWRSFDYIALATVLVAAIPINGILLQNSITTVDSQRGIHPNVTKFAIAKSLPRGFSAELKNGKVSGLNSPWQYYMTDLIGNAKGFFETTSDATTVAGIATTHLTGIGFNVTCKEDPIPFDLPLDGQPFGNNTENTILAVDLSWKSSTPYTLILDTKFKNTSDCSGNLSHTVCTLELGTVQHTVQVTHKPAIEKFVAHGREVWQWVVLSQFENSTLEQQEQAGYVGFVPTFLPCSNFEPFHDLSEELAASENTTFGGIADSLAYYFNGGIKLDLTGNTTDLKYDGFFASQQDPLANYDENYNLINVSDTCNAFFSSKSPYPPFFTTHGDAAFNSPSDFMLDQIRTTLFYTSLQFSASEYDFEEGGYGRPRIDGMQSVTNVTDYVTFTVYENVIKWWFGSLAVTIAIILFILPTFYGFWTLARKTTLSPFETARAFHAPMLDTTAANLDTQTLLKEVGRRNVHTDLAVAEIKS